jgi:hypothetical protein
LAGPRLKTESFLCPSPTHAQLSLLSSSLPTSVHVAASASAAVDAVGIFVRSVLRPLPAPRRNYPSRVTPTSPRQSSSNSTRFAAHPDAPPFISPELQLPAKSTMSQQQNDIQERIAAARREAEQLKEKIRAKRESSADTSRSFLFPHFR